MKNLKATVRIEYSHCHGTICKIQISTKWLDCVITQVGSYLVTYLRIID